MSELLTATGQPNLSGNSKRYRAPNISRVYIPANGSTGIPSYGFAFYIVASTAEVKVKTDKTGFLTYKQGTGEQFTEDLEFQRLEFLNPNAFPVVVDIWYGFGAYIDRRFELLDAPTSAVGSSATLAGGADIDYLATPTGNQLRRKYAIITNRDAANPLILRDLDGNEMATIFAEQNFVIDSSAGFNIFNDTGAGIAYQVAEVWYVNSQL